MRKKFIKEVMDMRGWRLLWPLVTSLLVFHPVSAEDYPGSRDHPIISRYPGSEIVHYDQREFDEYYLLLGPVKSTSDKDIENAPRKKLEGRVTKITYKGPKGRSNLEVYKNYEIALEQAGFEILYKARGNEIRGAHPFLERFNRQHLGGWTDPDEHPIFYLSAKSPDEKYFVSVFVHGEEAPVVVLAVVEPKGMETGLITAETMKSQIARTGKVALYGIYFDFDSAEIKKESKPTLDEIAKLLKENPDLKLFVVGHTDNIGKLEYNMELSRRRAEAVVKALVENYGVDKGRLKAFGVGPLCPCASNKTETGRARNRRVELVEQ